ncbi:MAG TPA: PQQ-dependent sugar dehydrogenase [Polyangia bacterium]|nr:PQQ-dependent sugar dehydrogenase [Polyangia bacterium]
MTHGKWRVQLKLGRRAAIAGLVATSSFIACGARAVDHTVDFTAEAPGTSHHRTVESLPPPNATRSAENDARIVDRPKDAWPRVPEGFRVRLYAEGIANPRALRTAPNGDVFVADSTTGALRVLRGVGADGRALRLATYVSDLDRPFGVAFSPPGPAPKWLYVAETGVVVRFAYTPGDLAARGAPERIATLPGGGHLRGGGHWTRDLAFSRDGSKLYASVGSRSNVEDTDHNPDERNRADILEMTPEGKSARVYAAGIRNPVGIAVSPRTGELWTSVNERDELGDDLVPDYVTHVVDGGFYGWPWFYTGGHQDPRHAGKHPELRDKVIVPDVLLPAHSASLELVFYDGAQFPAAYRGDVFAAEHGSWNRSVRSGYEVVRIPVDEHGRARGTYEDFLTGFVTPTGDVWGRPVGVAVAADGALLVSDDAGGCVWRIEATRR